MTFSDEMDKLVADVEATFGAAITLTSIAKGAMDLIAGTRAETTSSQSVLANRLPAVRDVATSGDGRTNREVRRYGIRAASITIGTPERGWRITDGSVTLEVIAVEWDADRKNYILTGGVRA